MKNSLTGFVLILFLISCTKIKDDTNDDCKSNCTRIAGRFVTLNNKPVSNIIVKLQYKIPGGELGGGSIRKIVNIKSDQNGNFYKNFYIKDSELGDSSRGYFQIEIDDSRIDVNKYIRTNNLFNSTSILGFTIYSITNRDTLINRNFYIPTKTYIKVNLNNFIPQKPDDNFEVQTLYPFGAEVAGNTFLNSPYSTGFSGYGIFKASKLNNRLNVFVAEGEKNIIRIFKRKNGMNSSEDYPITVPPNNTIELTYDF